MTWRKKNDWEGYKDFLLNTDIGSEFYTRYDYKLKRNVGPENAPQQISDKINKLESGTERIWDDNGELIVYRDKNGEPIVNKKGTFIPKLSVPNDEVKVARMNTWMKRNMHATTKKFRKHMFTFMYLKRFAKFKGE